MKITDINKHTAVNSPLVKEGSKLSKEAQNNFALKLKNLKGDALHAETLKFFQPRIQEERVVRADMPEDIKELIAKLSK